MPSPAGVCCLSSVLVLLLGALAAPRVAAYGVDAGTGAEVFRKNVAEPFGITAREVRWQRVRGLPNPETADAETIARARDELHALRARGARSAVMLRFGRPSWAKGVRSGGGQRMPLDLREAFERGRAYAAAYGDLVDAWEIDNEPDISFVEDNPETFTAYFKAIALGLKATKTPASRLQTAECGRQTADSERSSNLSYPLSSTALPSALRHLPSGPGRRWPVKAFYGRAHPLDSGLERSSAFGRLPSGSPPLVLMAPLALPPGPYLEQSLHNDLLSYTDGFNYHYYGYPEDFTGVYRQFEDAVTRFARADDRWQTAEVGGQIVQGGERRSDGGSEKLSSAIGHRPSESRTVTRELPVFLTEYGYGLMSGEAAGAVEGRVRQWRWFADVLPQVRALRIKGPMAFVAMPYLEQGHNEFGLMVKTESREQRAESLGGQRAEGRGQRSEVRDRIPGVGAKKPRDAASPFGLQPPSSGLRSQVSGLTQPPTPDLRSLISGRPPTVFAEGEGSLVLYNFSAETISGRLELPEGFTLIDPPEKEAHGAATPSSRASAKEPAKASAPGAAEPSPRVSEPNATGASRPHLSADTFEAGGVVFTPEDFGAKRVEPWMKRIGAGANQSEGDSDGTASRWEASPAAAFLWDYAAGHPYRSRPWAVRVAAPSPVVIDFLPGKGLQQYKAAGGYVVGGVSANDARRSETRDQRSEIGDPTSDLGLQTSGLYRLPPGERVVVPVRIRVQAEQFVASPIEARYVPDDPTRSLARWSTQLVPAATGMTSTVVARFDHAAEAAGKSRALLLERPLAREEPALKPYGRWLVSDGVDVLSDSADKPPSAVRPPSSEIWRFRVDAFPEEPLRPAMAELPLPDGFAFEPGSVLSLQHRIEAARSANPQRPHMLEVQVRMANGNLYQVWPRQFPQAEWRPYWQHVDNFTLGFFGRAALPWRFQDNEPVALVFFFRPASLPATFEFSQAALVRWRSEPDGNADLR